MKTLPALLTLLVSFNASALTFDAAKDKSCRDQLQKSLCYTDFVPHWALAKGGKSAKTKALEAYQERKCQKLPEAYGKTLLSLYDSYPAEVKVAFCDIKRLFIVKGEVSYGAETEYYFSRETSKFGEDDFGMTIFKGTPTGYVLSISEKNRFKNETSSDYSTRVTQNRFGHSTVANGISSALPVVEHDDGYGSNGALATTIVHEIGHMLSRASRSTKIFFMPRAATTWSQFSWSVDEMGSSPLRGAEMWEKIRSKSVPSGDVSAAIDYLRSAGQPSFYAATNPEEEFAETYMLMLFPRYRLSFGGQVMLDVSQEFETNSVLRAKREYIQTLLAKPSPFDLKKHGPIGGQL